MDKYPISVIVPVYNTERDLGRCIDSLLKQTMPVRIILVDDGSEDHCAERCDQYAEKYDNIRVIHKQNGGAGSARNAGIDHAESEFIGFVDSDDWVTEDMFEYLYQLQQKSQADVAQIEYVMVPEGSAPRIEQRKETLCCLENREEILKRYLLDGMKPIKSYSSCTKLYRKALFSNVRFPEKYAYDDVTTNYDILMNADKYVISNRQCYFYHIRNESITQGVFHASDLDYIKAGEMIAEKTRNDIQLQKLGLMTAARFHFTCLCKMLKYGCDPEMDWKGQIRRSIPIIRSGIPNLLRSGMKPDRKCIMLLLCANIGLTTRLVQHRMK